jgi:hypothetical protein
LCRSNNDLIDATSPDSTCPATPSSTTDVETDESDKHEKKAERLVRLIAEGSRDGCRAIQKVDSATRERILEESTTCLDVPPIS